MTALRSPVTGRPLHRDTPHSLSDGAGERWPVVDDIAYLRIDGAAEAALAALDAGQPDAALGLLLAENDRWWDGAPPHPAALAMLIAGRDILTLREAMTLLGYGRVGTYFAHRWSDPTFAAGLALLDAHWTAPRSAFELACGIGHYLRELDRLGVACIGADIVFSKLWLARHWVVGPAVELVCFDADRGWPLDAAVDLALCHDAFYFFADQPGIAAKLALARVVALAHVHNRDWPTLSGGAALSLAELRALFPGARLYDDAGLTEAAAAGTIPSPSPPAHAEAFAVVTGFDGACLPATGPLLRPADGTALRRNPLVAGDWPSARYADEYGARATYRGAAVPATTVMAEQWTDAVARRALVDLPARW